MNNKSEYSRAETEIKIETAKVKKSAWYNVLGKIKLLSPHVWPKENPWMQARLVFCIVLVLLRRVFNVFVPRIQKDIVDILARADGSFPYDLILILTTIKILQGGAGSGRGLVNSLKSLLWIKVEQRTSKSLKLSLFNHLHRLGVRWHQTRKTGEVLRVMDRGSSSVTTILNTAFFQIVPIFIDVLVAMFALSFDLNPYFGLIILVTMLFYLSVAVIGTECRTKFKRKMNQADNDQRARSVDSLLNSETVKLYTKEEYESEVFSKFMTKYQRKEWLSLVSMHVFNINQTLILNIGLMVGSLYSASLISQQRMTVGDYILFGTYMIQLAQPLNQLATFYRTMQEAIINMENMIELMEEEEEVKDLPNAVAYNPEKTDICLENVSFHYNFKQPILTNINCHIAQGSSVAIVGPSGSGKSTLIKLLLRFYDPTDGKILIGGQNIQHLQKTSLRRHIGVVPQDTVLFNETIEYNINYGYTGAGDESPDTEGVARAAEIHDGILQLPQGYETVVGERGLKLSGGEKQRVAIARTLLRRPRIIVLDEATSALDTQTELNIQATLSKALTGLTRLTVAHRLSTVVEADLILVLDQGRIVESGSHAELLQAEGKYAEMWSVQQISSQSGDAG